MPSKSLKASIRTAIFWIHLAVGVAASGIILMMCVTGVLLGFERQMIGWIDGVPRVESPSLGGPRLALDTLLARANIPRDSVASIVVRAAPAEPTTVRFRDRATPARALDPYTAALIPTPQGGGGQAFFSALRRWHRWMGASAAEARARAKAATGAANLAFLFLVLSGLWLWWPRRWTRAAWRTAAVPQPALRGKARDFNWHHAVGFWSAIPLALVVGTAVFISYQWPGRLLDRTLGNAEERAAARAPRPASAPSRTIDPEHASARRGRGPGVALESLLLTAQRARPEWRSVTLTVAAPRDSAHSLLVAEGNTYRPDLRTTFVLGVADGALVATRDFSSLSTSRKIRAWVRFGHTGEVFGVPGQIVATLVTAAGAVLVWTGIALSLRRFAAWRRRRSRDDAGAGALADVAG